MDECQEWLHNLLVKDKLLLCDFVREEAKKQRFTRGQLKTARKILGVKTFHQFDESGSTQNWFWSLPESGELKCKKK